jgi:histidyl-tRNA synthetase
MKLKVQRPRGMKDIVLSDADFYLKIRDLIVDFSLNNNFKYIETPVIEDIKTFTLSLGQTSDVVEKEMFIIKGKDSGQKYVLRPEMTASVVRAYFENSLMNLPQPVSLFYFSKVYRHERPQHGRLREHTQWGLEILNTEDPFADFYVIFLVYNFLLKLKLKNITIKINSIGCSKCRTKYKEKLKKYYQKHQKKLCSDCQRRLKQNPLRLLDCKAPEDQEYKKYAPNILDYLCRFCRIHFQKVLELLDYWKIPYELDPTLVRGFDYYYRTVFEIFVGNEEVAIAGGGRYDLGEVIADEPLPSVGVAVGIERLKLVLDDLISFKKTLQPKIFVAFAGEETRSKALEIYLQLQENNFRPISNFFKTSLSAQLEYANKIGVKYSLILGVQELAKSEIILKDLEYGNQEILKISELTKTLKKLIKN